MNAGELIQTTDAGGLDAIQRKICVIRGVHVMLDRDLADLYQVELRVFNQAVRRNLRRFPDNFMFEVDKDEIRPLITDCDVSGKMRYWPQKSMVFTEQGIAMLSAVLRSERKEYGTGAVDVEESWSRGSHVES